MNDLRAYFDQNQGRLIHKWDNYFDIYDRYFARYRNTDVHILEFGVSHGGSLEMWRSYFGSSAKIYGVDINPQCQSLEGPQVEIFIGDQEDRRFLQSLVERIPRIDILIDDGGHTMAQQIATFEELYDHVSEDGIYLCEDLQTSYWKRWGGGYRRSGTFIEYSKNLIDKIHAWHSKEPRRLLVSRFTRSTRALHFYDGILVIEKGPISEPHDIQSGTPSIPEYKAPKKPTLLQRIRRMTSR